jgi:hypothetical protein
MRVPSTAITAIALSAAIAACGSSPAATSTPGATLAPGATATPAGATQAPTGAPTAAPTGGASSSPIAGTGRECEAVPTFSIGNPDPASPPPDTGLLAHFPAAIDGQPLTDVQAIQWVWFLCSFGGQAAVDQAIAEAEGSFNLATMSFGGATATVDGEEVSLTAFRTPGSDANAMVTSLALIAASTGNTGVSGAVQTATISGKSVYIWTDEDGAKSYAYPSGDTLIFFGEVTESQAAKIIAALV